MTVIVDEIINKVIFIFTLLFALQKMHTLVFFRKIVQIPEGGN